jgi:signal peptidase
MTEAALSLPSVRSSHLPQARIWMRRIAWALLTLSVLLVAASAIAVRTGYVQIAPVDSGSMRPGIHEGDLVVTRAVSADSLVKGDTIVFHPPGQTDTTIHRIVSIERLGDGKIAFTSKGDANPTVDPWGKVTTKGTAYKVATVVPKMGWLVNGGLLWVVVGFTFLFAAVIIRWLVKRQRA